MLKVAVTIVYMVNVIAVHDGLAAIPFGVRDGVVRVNHFFSVRLTIVKVVDVIAVDDCLVTVSGKVLVVSSRVCLG
jgi:hypothetical protein